MESPTNETIIHAPAIKGDHSFCGAVTYDSSTFGQQVTCPACIEMQLEYAQGMAEIEAFGAEYYAAVENEIKAALCLNNAHVYAQRAEQLRNELQQAA